MTRRLIRRLSFILVYQFPFHQEYDVEQAASRLFGEIRDDAEVCDWLELKGELTEENCQFVLYEGNGTVQHISEIDDLITRSLKSWDVDRMVKTDLAVIRLAIFESFFSNLEIEHRVATNEAVELAKLFGGDASPSFVNGVLRKIFLVNHGQV